MSKFWESKLNSRGKYKRSLEFDEDLLEALDEAFDIPDGSFPALIQDALWHFISCAENVTKESSIDWLRKQRTLEKRVTSIEATLRNLQVASSGS